MEVGVMPKTDPDLDPERSADREAVALAMVTLTNGPDALPQEQTISSVKADEDEHQARKKQRKRPRENEKVCRVCGDKALAHNFDAITCESCKAFFRRNALRPDRIPCLFNGKCCITVQTRRFCPSCRLEKCFSEGMKADLILDDAERKARMDKVSENRAKRQAKECSDVSDLQIESSSHAGAVSSALDLSTGRISSPAVVSPIPPTLAATQRHQNSVNNSHNLHKNQPNPQQSSLSSAGACPPSCLETLQKALVSPPTALSPVMNVPAAGFQPSKLPSPSLSESSHSRKCNQHLLQASPSLDPPSNTANVNSTTTARMATWPASPDFQHVPRDLLPSDPHMYWRLSEEEKTVLTQLSSAFQDTVMSLPDRVPCGDGKPFNGAGLTLTLEGIFDSSEKNLTQLVDFLGRLGDFHCLRDDDKIAILQASGLCSSILRWTAMYVVERQSWLTRFGECNIDQMFAVYGHKDCIRKMAAFCQDTKLILKNDVTLFVLTHCLILFDPRVPNLVDRQMINSFKDKYMVLLKHYLESEYSFLYTDRYMRAIMDKTCEIHQVADSCLSVMKEFNDYIPPLMKQFLDLS